MFPGALNKSVIDGNTILLKIGEENGRHKDVHISDDKVCFFITSDNIYEYISNMGNNLSPYSVATCEENYYLLAPNFQLIIKEVIDYNELLNGIFPCEGETFKELELCKIITNYD